MASLVRRVHNVESDLRALERVVVVEMAALATRIEILEEHADLPNPFPSTTEVAVEQPAGRPDRRTSHAGAPRPSRFGALLLEERRRRGWTQQRMADELQISRETLSHLETGRITMPEHAVLQRIVRRLGISSATLIESLDLFEEEE